MTPPLPRLHGLPLDAQGRLLLGGQPLSHWAEVLGQTPFYLYDRACIAERVAALRAALPAGWQLHYAVKANPMPALVQCLAGLVDGLDVASAGELRTALDTGMAPGHVSFAGPGKREAELRQAAAAGIVVNVESERELHALAAAAQALGRRPPVALRINPDFEMKGAAARMGGGPRPFGVDAEQAPALLAAMRTLPLEFVGFHLYFGSQNLQAEGLAQSQRQALALAERLAPHAPGPVRLLNLGGGLGIPYFPGERPLDLAALSAAMHALAAPLAAAFPQAVPVLELGRYLVGEAGVYVCRVIDRKVSRGQVFLVTDGGLHHHLAASGNLGQVLRRNYPVVLAERAAPGPDEATEVASVVGPLCTGLDLLGDRLRLPPARLGDLVAVLASGAYGASASPNRFLGHPPPLEALV
ncbi:pyridoxal-dependent decarboxylase, exosortase A system-associated [Piscinibacter sakaiensis]|uniref:Diaminopimelate decarboxylase n=1 Tax=Piscinibacter sakaiensis TaxID=1547922 RepID=A0A0K8NZN6_PISS1|nr:pyridoxal-dependent decarboxylase, exosortase A system-associated [Piscinibacter sakaiensis]GAP35867.1 diaminopimelate decarboxylase [Piscinibacter sakaiensis]